MTMRQISRRVFNLAAGSLMAAPHWAWPAPGKVPDSLDHVILGCNDLDAGVDYVYQRTGIRAAPGGVHPGAGTRNALLSLGTLRYLEIIAPDPLQSASTDPRHVASLKNPALVGWAAHRGDLNGFASALQSAGVECLGPKPGSRARPNGTTLTWKSLTLKDDSNGILPFFIEWGANSLHPSVDAPAGCRLTDLSITTPNPAELQALLAKLQLDVQIRKSHELRLAATIVGPKGSMTLLSRI
jgi:Glyoxalase-like domain